MRKLAVLSAVWIISGVAFSTLELFIPPELKFVIIALLWLFGGAVVGLVSFFRSAQWALAE
ncbi:hypothetical protein [Thermococcus sp. JCM 11816]|uniref:hypothetical protein n=1 Tax=Thermococcus sp. (strain JCM 11816 / KS-1) TaxID=1295125 RepID=UPI003466E9DA